MDEELSRNIRKYIYDKTYGTSSFFDSYIRPVDVWLPIIDEEKDYLTLEFKGVLCNQDECVSKKTQSNLQFNKSELAGMFTEVYFKSSDDTFYKINRYTFDDTFLELSVKLQSLEMYIDLIPEEIKMVIMTYLNKQDTLPLIKIKSDFIRDNEIFWNRLAGYRFGKWYQQITDEINKRRFTWKWVYPQLVDLIEDISLDNYMMLPFSVPEYREVSPIILNILNKIRLKIEYPYISKFDLPDNYVKLVLHNMNIDPYESEYLKTGKITPSLTPYEISGKNPEVLYDFITNPNFKPYGINDLVYILNSLRKDEKLFENYILKLYKEDPELLVEFIHNFDIQHARHLHIQIVPQIHAVVGII